MKEVSVVIPTYNRPKYLDGAIRTVLGQTLSNLEILVVDDGSDQDYATEICSQYEEVKLVQHDTNKGLSAARNTGIDHASGEFIAFLDDDDRWHKTKLERQLDALESNPDAGIASCLVSAITPENDLLRAEQSRPDGDLTQQLLEENVIGTPSRVLMRANCLDEINGFDEDLPTKQDWDLYLRVSYEWDVVVLNDHLCYRTLHESMSSDPIAHERDRRAVIEKHRADIERWGDINSTLANYYTETGRVYYENGNTMKAQTAYQKALSHRLSRRTLLLYSLSYVPRPVFNGMLTVKRKLEARRDKEGGGSLEQVPGLQAV